MSSAIVSVLHDSVLTAEMGRRSFSIWPDGVFGPAVPQDTCFQGCRADQWPRATTERKQLGSVIDLAWNGSMFEPGMVGCSLSTDYRVRWGPPQDTRFGISTCRATQQLLDTPERKPVSSAIVLASHGSMFEPGVGGTSCSHGSRVLWGPRRC